MTKRFRINRIVCDQDNERPYCIKIPKYECRPGTAAQCRMEPQQVCQPSCQQSSQCQQCNNFMQQGPGFGSCPTSNCFMNWPGDILGNASTGNVGGGFYPGGGDIGGGSGFYPGGGGTGGGSGYFPGESGVVVEEPEGGSGFFPGGGGGGDIGGGGGGYFPGGSIVEGGGNLFPGSSGGSGGYYPGGNVGSAGGYYPGDSGFYPGGPNPGDSGTYGPPGTDLPRKTGFLFQTAHYGTTTTSNRDHLALKVFPLSCPPISSIVPNTKIKAKLGRCRKCKDQIQPNQGQ